MLYLKHSPTAKLGRLTRAQQSSPCSMQASPAKAPAAGKPQGKSTKTHLPSGDDLGDEFAIEIDAAEDEGAKKKKKRPVEDSVAETVADGMGKAAKPKKSKPKVVKF